MLHVKIIAKFGIVIHKPVRVKPPFQLTMASVQTALIVLLSFTHTCVGTWHATVQDKLLCEYLWPGSYGRMVAPREGNGGYVIHSALVKQLGGRYTTAHQYQCKIYEPTCLCAIRLCSVLIISLPLVFLHHMHPPLLTSGPYRTSRPL